MDLQREIIRRLNTLEAQVSRLTNQDPGAGLTDVDATFAADLTVNGTLGVNGMTKTGTSLVANLNADLLDGLHAPIGNLGTWTVTWGCVSGTQPSIGNGAMAGWYLKFGKICIATLTVTFGSTSTYGTGGFYFSLPFASSAIHYAPVWMRDTGTTHYRGVARVGYNESNIVLYVDHVSSVRYNVPWTWAAGDELGFTLAYTTMT